jgi:hypothetical protein
MPLIDYGAVTMGSTGIPLISRTRRVGGQHLAVAPPKEELAGEPGIPGLRT